jgi:hypothetical protein
VSLRILGSNFGQVTTADRIEAIWADGSEAAAPREPVGAKA